MPYRDLIIVGGSSLAGAVTFAGARGLYEKVKADRAGEELKWSLIAPKLASAALAGAFVGYLTGEIIKRHSGSIFRERRVGRSSTDFSRKDLAFLERNNIDATTRAKPLPLVQAPTLAPIEIFDLRRRRITGPSWIGAAEVKIAEALKGKATAGSGWSQEALGAGLKAVQEASAHHPGQLHAAVVLLDNTVDAIKGCVPELTGSQSGTTALQTVQTLIDRKDYISAIIQSAEGWRAHGGRQFLDLLQAAVFRFSTQGLG